MDPKNRLIRMAELATRPGRPGFVPASPNTVWRWTREGRFPKPVRLGEGITAWRLADVEAWLEQRRAGGA